MLIGLVTVVPSSETERPWCFFLISPPRVHARVWSGLSQTLTTLLARALPRLSGRTKALGWEAQPRALLFGKAAGGIALDQPRAPGPGQLQGTCSAFHAWRGSRCTSFCLLLFAPLAWPCRWPQSQAFLLGKHEALSSLLLLSSSPTIW